VYSTIVHKRIPDKNDGTPYTGGILEKPKYPVIIITGTYTITGVIG